MRGYDSTRRRPDVSALLGLRSIIFRRFFLFVLFSLWFLLQMSLVCLSVSRVLRATSRISLTCTPELVMRPMETVRCTDTGSMPTTFASRSLNKSPFHTRLKRHPALFGIPFLLVMVGASFGLQTFTQTRYDLQNQKVTQVTHSFRRHPIHSFIHSFVDSDEPRARTGSRQEPKAVRRPRRIFRPYPLFICSTTRFSERVVCVCRN